MYLDTTFIIKFLELMNNDIDIDNDLIHKRTDNFKYDSMDNTNKRKRDMRIDSAKQWIQVHDAHNIDVTDDELIEYDCSRRRAINDDHSSMTDVVLVIGDNTNWIVQQMTSKPFVYHGVTSDEMGLYNDEDIIYVPSIKQFDNFLSLMHPNPFIRVNYWHEEQNAQDSDDGDHKIGPTLVTVKATKVYITSGYTPSNWIDANAKHWKYFTRVIYSHGSQHTECGAGTNGIRTLNRLMLHYGSDLIMPHESRRKRLGLKM